VAREKKRQSGAIGAGVDRKIDAGEDDEDQRRQDGDERAGNAEDTRPDAVDEGGQRLREILRVRRQGDAEHGLQLVERFGEAGDEAGELLLEGWPGRPDEAAEAEE